jgi:hypothetical protein
MATETGTATDYRDLLQKLKLFLTGANSPTSGLTWVVERERSDSTSPLSAIPDGSGAIKTAANNNQSHDEIIFRGNGGVSPEKAIYFGIQTYGLSTTGFFNWHIRGLTGFSNTSPETPFLNQPGHSPPCYLPLQNTTMTYWFIANERRVMGVVKTGTAYHPFYMGLINPFATDVEYPYPMAVMATAGVENTLFSSNSIIVASPLLHGGGNANGTIPAAGDDFPANECSGWIRFVDGNWYSVKHFSGTSSESGISGASQPAIAHVWPWSGASNTGFPIGHKLNVNFNFNTNFRTGNPGGNPSEQMLSGFGSPELRTLWPCTPFLINQLAFLGEFDGVYWVPGSGGVTSEDTITDTGESPEVQHIIFQNVWRTDRWTFLAMRNE